MEKLILGFVGIIAVALSVLAYVAINGMIVPVAAGSEVRTSYEDIVVILLTTVTVIFTVSALVLSVLAFIGPRALKREAGKFAERAVRESIEAAWEDEGKATKLMEKRLPPEDGPIKVWMEDRIDQQVVELLPLILDRRNVGSEVGPVDPGQPDDEGRVD